MKYHEFENAKGKKLSIDLDSIVAFQETELGTIITSFDATIFDVRASYNEVKKIIEEHCKNRCS